MWVLPMVDEATQPPSQDSREVALELWDHIPLEWG